MADIHVRTYQPADGSAEPSSRAQAEGLAEVLDALAALINAADVVDRVGFATTASRLESFLHRPGLDPTRDLFLAEADGQLVGYAHVEPRRGQREDVIRCTGAVLPTYRRRGIGTLLLRHAYQRVCELRARGPRGNHPTHFDIHARQGMAGLNELAESFGMRPVCYFFWMVHPDLSTLAEPDLPAGLRLVDCTTFHDLAARAAAFNEAFAQHWGFTPIRVEATEYMVRQPSYQPENSLLALDETGEVAGFCTADTTADVVQRLNGDTGQVSTLGVRPAYRHRGLGRALLLSALHRIRAVGLPKAALGVDGENVTGAKRLYESVGFREANRSIVYRREVE